MFSILLNQIGKMMAAKKSKTEIFDANNYD